MKTREKNLELWGEDLFNAFSDHINEDGWLTADWNEILEENYSDWDEDMNDTNEKRDLYSEMYNMEFDLSEDEKFIRPNHDLPDLTPKRLFIVGEEINHKKFGVGTVTEVFEEKIRISFQNGPSKKFLTCVFECDIL